MLHLLKFTFLTIALFLLNFNGLSKGIKLKTGHWHADFKLAENVYLPIDFELNKKPYTLKIINGSEEIILNNISTNNDSIIIKFDLFDSEFRVKAINKSTLSGCWYNYAKSGNYFLPFKALHGEQPRYALGSKNFDITGRWEVYFDYTNIPEKAVGLFNYTNPSSNRVVGTFLTETGDYRFLDGAVIEDSLYLSTFDGSHAFLFGAENKNDTLFGFFKSGKHYTTNWYAVKNATFELTNPDSLTFVVNEQPISFTLPDLNGEDFTFPNKDSENTVTIIQILGTWCPNCWDESVYIKSLQETYGEQLNIIAVTFETPEKLEDKISKVHSYKENLGLNYTFVIGGKACKQCASEIFPQLNEIISFPTMIIMDKKGNVRKIHTGFNGPGTGGYYTQFVASTNAFIAELIKE